MRLRELEHARVAIWGAGHEARAAFAALRARFPDKPLTLLCRASERAQAEGFADAATMIVADDAIGRERLSGFDYVVKSPGISPYHAPASEATGCTALLSGTALWFAENPDARTIGVTGTKGKSTTTALIAHLLRASGRRVALCGNIGVPLLELVEPAIAPDWWAIELSSFQTRDMGTPPEIAVLLNLYPEHLDWHGSIENYVADKLAILGKPGRRPRVAVLNAQQPLPDALLPMDCDVRWFGNATGYHVRDGAIHFGERTVLALDRLPLPGAHNALNACAALTAVAATGINASVLAESLESFRPLPHRLQPLGVRDGIEYVNDSISTTPHATLAALAHYRGRQVTVLVGGHDRGLDWSAFREALEDDPPFGLVTMGANGARIAALLEALPADAPHRAQARTLAEALALARGITPAGGVVLLSPGAPSFGEFRDYVDRGRSFARLAGFDPSRIATIEGLGL